MHLIIKIDDQLHDETFLFSFNHIYAIIFFCFKTITYVHNRILNTYYKNRYHKQ